jgi:hypothetical protein
MGFIFALLALRKPAEINGRRRVLNKYLANLEITSIIA